MSSDQLKEVTLEEISDLLAEGTVTDTLDIGVAIIHQITHPTLGRLTAVNLATGRCAILQ